MSDTTTYERPGSVLLAPTEDGFVAYDTVRGRLHRLNPTAGLLAELCDGSRSVDELGHHLRPLVGAAWPRWQRWLEEATSDGLLTSTGGGGEPSAPELHRLAHRLQQRDEVLGAWVCQRRAAELAPQVPDYWLRLGELAHITGRRTEAHDAYRRYLDHQPDDAEVAHLVLALADEAPPNRVPDRCLEQLYDRFATFYDENMVDELGYRAPDQLHEAVRAHQDDHEPASVLDLGCGTGLSGVRWRAHTAALVGVDLSPAMVARARQRGIYDRLHQSEITRWLREAPGERFDLVLACDTLIYFGDLSDPLRLAGARLTPTGLLAFTAERGDHAPFRLSDSGRFTHHPDHIRAAVAAAELTLLGLDESVLRSEYGEPVTGLIAVCGR